MKNKYIIENNYIKIFLHRRNSLSDLETIIDLDDFDKVNGYKGSFYAGLNRNIGQYYVKINVCLGLFDGKLKHRTPHLNRIVLDCDDWDYEVDHINKDTLDNRAEEMRQKYYGEFAGNK